jgi:hypothetical protein
MHRRAFLKGAVSVAALSTGGEAGYAWDLLQQIQPISLASAEELG